MTLLILWAAAIVATNTTIAARLIYAVLARDPLWPHVLGNFAALLFLVYFLAKYF